MSEQITIDVEKFREALRANGFHGAGHEGLILNLARGSRVTPEPVAFNEARFIREMSLTGHNKAAIDSALFHARECLTPGVYLTLPLSLDTARALGRCRICGKAAHPILPPESLVLNNGKEFAHRSCLDKLKPVMPDGPRPEFKAWRDVESGVVFWAVERDVKWLMTKDGTHYERGGCEKLE